MPSRVSSARFQQYKPSKLIDYFNLKNYVVFDVETTGLSSKTEEIIEIAIAKITNGQQTSTFTSLVNPGKTLPSKIVSLTGLTDEMLKNAPVFSVSQKMLNNLWMDLLCLPTMPLTIWAF